MADIFDEVEEDLRRKRAEDLWKKNWPIFAGIAVAVILGVGGWRFYEWREAERAASAGARYERALADASRSPAEAQRIFDQIAADAPAGYRTLARFRAAAELSSRDRDGAIRAYDGLAADGSIGAIMQDLARVRAAMLLIDTAPLTDIAARLEPLATPAGTYRHTARELLALAAVRANDRAAADRWLAAIQTDAETPQGLRGRAEIIASVLAGAQ